MKRIAPLLALSMALLPTAYAAGQRTHLEMADQALERFVLPAEALVPGLGALLADPRVRKAYYAGAMFPDWGYAGIHQHAAEDAHWHDFHAALTAHARRRWETGDTPSAAARRLAGFTLGVVVHGLTDIPWHFGRRAFIREAERKDGVAESLIEPGLDLHLARGKLAIRFSGRDLRWPTEDLQAVYAGRPHVPTRTQLLRGFNRQVAVWYAAAGPGRLLRGGAMRRMPWTMAHLDGHGHGGIRHSAALAALGVRWTYARLRGWRLYQQAPRYARGMQGPLGYRGVSDTSVGTDAPGYDAGGEPLLAAGAGRELLIRFALDGLPRDRRVTRARLWLYRVATPEARSLRLAASSVGAPWRPGRMRSDAVDGLRGLRAAPGAGVVDWSTRPAHAQRADVQALDGRQAGWVGWDVTALVRGWQTGRPNHGVAVHPVGEASGVARFLSSDAWDEQADQLGGGTRIARRPTLVIELAPVDRD